MSDTTVDATTPRAWVGCLSCYNSGRLVGEWYDAADADEVSAATLHVDAGTVARIDCADLWVLDHEHLPISGECSPAEAAEWGRLIAEVDEWERDAFLAWLRAGNYSHNGLGVPDAGEFRDVYAGEWSTFREYAENLADEIGLLSDVPEEVARYFDWAGWTQDLAYDHNVEATASNGVFVFRTH
ncbi:MAG: antirestriction protein ArdA [Propionibacteriales bacterium]|nr:antirestriction protein ArdA [Propionibacteriales bacterium]